MTVVHRYMALFRLLETARTRTRDCWCDVQCYQSGSTDGDSNLQFACKLSLFSLRQLIFTKSQNILSSSNRLYCTDIVHTTPPYRTTIPHYHTTTIPHHHITLPYHTTIPTYHIPHYHTTLPFNITIPHYHTTLPFHITIPHYRTTLPFQIPISYYHTTLQYPTTHYHTTLP